MAKNSASSVDELAKIVNEQYIAKALSALADEVFNNWYKKLKENWYDQYDPVFYQRTEAILKALIKTDIKKIGKYMQVSVYIDESIMSQYHPNSQSDISGLQTLYLIEYEGMTLKNGIERKPAMAYEEVIEWLRASYATMLKNQFSKDSGIIVKI